jgi:hypothetical protein
MALPPVKDLEMYQGDDFEHWFIFTDNAVPRNLSLVSSGKAQLRVEQDRESLLLATFDVDISDKANGRIAISLDDSIAATLPAGGAFYDLELINNGRLETFVRGAVLIEPEVTV